MKASLMSFGFVVSMMLAAGAHAQGAAAPLDTQESNWGSIAVDLTEFSRKGNSLTAKLRLRNTGSAKAEFDMTYKDVYLLDTAAGKKYEVLKDDQGTYIAAIRSGWPARNYGEIAPGASVTLWMKFPAPPPEVKSITLNIPAAAPFEDISITDK